MIVTSRRRRTPPLAACLALACLGVPAAAQVQLPYSYKAPPIPPLGATDIHVYPNGFQPVGRPFVPVSGYPLIEAIKVAELVYALKQDTVVLQVHGVIPASQGQQIGGGDAGIKPYRVHWQTAPIDVAVRGTDGVGTDEIQGFVVLRDLNDGTPTPGVKRFRVDDVSIRPPAFANSVISTPMGAQEPSLAGGGYALLQVFNCWILKGDGNPKWGARLHGRCLWDFRFNHFGFMVEHCLYADSPQGNSHFIANTTDGAGRTMAQIVNRTENPGPSGWGFLLFEDNIATWILGDGGSDFTVAGHLGTVIFRRNQSIEAPNQPASQGSIAVWTDVGHGAWLNPHGYSTDRVIIQDHVVSHPNADRDHIQVSGAEVVEIRGTFLIAGNQTAFAFDTPWGGPIPNGHECFYQPQPVSAYPGFQSAHKVKRGTTLLTDAQIDALHCP